MDDRQEKPRRRRTEGTREPQPQRSQKPSRVPWREQQTDHARSFGSEQPGSGCGSKKGDILGRILILEECKVTEAETIQVSKEVVMKICREALDMGRTPALGFGYAETPHGFPKEWVALSKNVQEVLYRIAEAALGDLTDPTVQEEIRAWTSRL